MNKSICVAIANVLILVVLAGCETTPVQDGAVVGGVLGAATGAIVGHQSGQQGEGALIGAGAGALLGALVGDQVERRGYAPINSAPGPMSQAPAGHYENRITRAPSGEYYEERVWVPGR